MEDSLPDSHMISRSGVTTWLSDSVVKSVTIHTTNSAAAHDILETGVRIAMSSPDAVWGQGFYSSTLPHPEYGTVGIRVAVRLTGPLIIRDSLAGPSLVQDSMQSALTESIRDAILFAGDDEVVIDFGPGDQWVVAFMDEQVKVIESRVYG